MKAFLVLAWVMIVGQAGPAEAVNLAVAGTHVSASFSAPSPSLAPEILQLAQNGTDYPIKPSEAAQIAQRTVPDSKVLNVKLLPSGEYVVTLKAGGNVQKVMVDATTGAAN